MGKRRSIRTALGVSQIVVAVRAGVSEPTVRVYEADPEAVRDVRKRAALDRVYAEMSASASSAAGQGRAT